MQSLSSSDGADEDRAARALFQQRRGFLPLAEFLVETCPRLRYGDAYELFYTLMRRECPTMLKVPESFATKLNVSNWNTDDDHLFKGVFCVDHMLHMRFGLHARFAREEDSLMFKMRFL